MGGNGNAPLFCYGECALPGILLAAASHSNARESVGVECLWGSSDRRPLSSPCLAGGGADVTHCECDRLPADVTPCAEETHKKHP